LEYPVNRIVPLSAGRASGPAAASAAGGSTAGASVPAASLPINSKAQPASLSFLEFGMAEPLLRGLAASGFVQPTEIQSRALPMALQGRDVMASAQTGTGKTAAFVLPALQRLLVPSKGAGHGPRVLVLTPTRELASQVESVVQELGRFTRLRIGSIVGGVSYLPQERLLRSPLDILVATPGRLLDHMDKRLVDFARLELLVLDEADRMLDMGFIKPVKQIAAALPRERQTMLFSATLEGEVLSVARQLTRDPVTVQLTTATKRHESITHRVHPASSPDHKHALLAHLLAQPELTQAIVFCATKRGAGKLAKRLVALGHKAAALHGNMRQSARNRTVELLRSGQVKLLIATDVAARGIDLEGVSHVINFDLPTVAEDYIHRTGRTGRNGATGVALSLVGPDDRVKLAGIERLIGRRLEQRGLAAVPPTAPAALPPQRGSLVRNSSGPVRSFPAQPGHGSGHRVSTRPSQGSGQRGSLVRNSSGPARTFHPQPSQGSGHRVSSQPSQGSGQRVHAQPSERSGNRRDAPASAPTRRPSSGGVNRPARPSRRSRGSRD
jgi:superfamily II DNA/RNA helicase